MTKPSQQSTPAVQGRNIIQYRRGILLMLSCYLSGVHVFHRALKNKESIRKEHACHNNKHNRTVCSCDGACTDSIHFSCFKNTFDGKCLFTMIQPICNIIQPSFGIIYVYVSRNWRSLWFLEKWNIINAGQNNKVYLWHTLSCSTDLACCLQICLRKATNI